MTRTTQLTSILLLCSALLMGCSSRNGDPNYGGSASGSGTTTGGSTSGGSTSGGSTGGGSTTTGTAGDDVLVGTPQQDTISGLDGNDTISGDADNDTLNGDNGNDTINGDAGDDTIDGGAGDDVLDGGDGNDTITGGDSGNDTINGGLGDDIIDGGPGADTMDGGDGSDTVSYHTSPAAVTVDLGLNTATGGDAAGDAISNFENARGTVAVDTLTGVDGIDSVLEGGPAGDTLDGGPNSANTVSYEHAPAAVTVDLNMGIQSGASDEDGDLLLNIQNVRGSAFDDALVGFDGGVGTCEGGPGADSFVISPNYGGNISYEHSPAGVNVSLSAGTASGGDATGDDVSNADIDGILGSAFADTLVGSDTWPTRLFGGAGNDTLTAGLGAQGWPNVLLGEDGDDTLTGGDAADNQLDGGPGADTIVGGNMSDVIAYDPADVSYDFMTTGNVDMLVVDQDIDFSNPGPTIRGLQDLAVPASGGTQITVTVTPADVTASTQGNLMMIDANPWTANSDAAITGTGWTANGTTNMFGVDYLRWEGANGAVLLVNPLVTNTSGL